MSGTIKAGKVHGGELGHTPYVVLSDEAGDWVGECRAELAPLFTGAADLLYSLRELVAVNEQWNEAVESSIGRPPTWNDAYLTAARAAILAADPKSESIADVCARLGKAEETAGCSARAIGHWRT